MKENREQILKLLEPLFERAEKEGLWFKTVGATWLTPMELRANHEKGYYVWVPDNWELKSPDEFLDHLEKDKFLAESDYRTALDRVEKFRRGRSARERTTDSVQR